MSNGTAAKDARRARRRATYAPSTLRIAGSRPVDVTVYDISETGIRFACDAALVIGDELSIGLAGYGVTRAYVAWRRNEQYGCDFVLPISPEAAARAFNAPTVVRFGGMPEAGETPTAVALEVDALYARHRRWALPRDVTIIAAMVGVVLALLAWLRP